MTETQDGNQEMLHGKPLWWPRSEASIPHGAGSPERPADDHRFPRCPPRAVHCPRLAVAPGNLLAAPRSRPFPADPTWREAQTSLCGGGGWCSRGLFKEVKAIWFSLQWGLVWDVCPDTLLCSFIFCMLLSLTVTQNPFHWGIRSPCFVLFCFSASPPNFE